MTVPPSVEASLLSSLKAHDSFFTRIIDMIPSELYKHSLSEDTDNAENTKYYKHRKLPLTADEKKILSKQKKAEKYAPPVKASKKSKTESDEEGESSDEEEQSSEDEAEESGDEHEEVVSIPSSSSAKQAVEYTSCNDLDTLRQRLQQRIQSMKGTRTSVKPHKVQAQEAADSKKANGAADTTGKNDKKDKKNNKKNKKRTAAEVVEPETEDKTVKAQKTATSTPHTASAASENETPAAKAEKIAADLEFNNMLMIGDTSSSAQTGVDKNKGKPGSKVQRLKRLLEEAQYKREKLTAMGKSSDPEEQQAMKNVKWSDALKSASGNKSLLIAGSGSGMDAEAKIKKALKRREKSKQKSAEEWKARLDAVEESKTARIDKRENNLQVRKNTKAGIVPDEEQVKKDKEAAKLGPKGTNNNINNTKSNNTHTEKKEGGGGGKGRAGFEGKKKDFLNKSHGGGGDKGGKQRK